MSRHDHDSHQQHSIQSRPFPSSLPPSLHAPRPPRPGTCGTNPTPRRPAASLLRRRSPRAREKIPQPMGRRECARPVVSTFLPGARIFPGELICDCADRLIGYCGSGRPVCMCGVRSPMHMVKLGMESCAIPDFFLWGGGGVYIGMYDHQILERVERG